MFTVCAVCRGNRVTPDGILHFEMVICPNCQGNPIVDEATGKPYTDDLWELINEGEENEK
jgi:hypothetical protein